MLNLLNRLGVRKLRLLQVVKPIVTQCFLL